MAATALDLCRRARVHGLIADWRGAPDLGAILATGPDVVAFLHNQLTSDVKGMGPGDDQLSARLTRYGSLVNAFSLHRLPERGQPFPAFLLVLPRSDCPALLADLERYVVTEEVLLEDATDDFTGWVIQGPKAEAVLATAWGSLEMPQFEYLALARSFTGDAGWLALWRGDAELPNGADPRQQLADAAATADFACLGDDATISRKAWDWLRVEAGWPLAGRDYESGAMVLPQTGLEQQVASYTKGCYLGQEVVARIRTYGSVPRSLRGLVLTGLGEEVLSSLPEPGSQLSTTEGQKIGSWASSAMSSVWEAPVALVYLDREHRMPGAILNVHSGGMEIEAQVLLTPFYQAANRQERARNLHERAVLLFSRGDDVTAAELLEQALRLDPGHADSYEALGVLLGRAERYYEAIDIFKRLEEVAPGEPMVHTNLSLFYMKIGDKESAEHHKALGTLKRFVGAEDEVTARQQADLEQQLQHDDARRKQAMFAEILEIDPEDPLALMGMGNALATLQEFSAAEPYLARACSVARDNSPLYASHGKVLERLGRIEEAAAVYRQGVAVAGRKGDLMPLREMEHRLLLLDNR